MDFVWRTEEEFVKMSRRQRDISNSPRINTTWMPGGVSLEIVKVFQKAAQL
jgi:hypothetical protein